MSNKPRKTNTEKPEELRLSRGRTRPEAIFPVAPSAASLPESYAATLQEIKTHLRNGRVRAVLAANPIVIEAYWNTGKIILERQKEAAWGAKVIDRLAADLQEAFPDMGGLSSRNLLSMKLFAEAFPDGPIAKQPVSQLPWGQIIRLIQMVKDPAAPKSRTEGEENPATGGNWECLRPLNLQLGRLRNFDSYTFIDGCKPVVNRHNSFVASCLRVKKLTSARTGSHEGTKTRRDEEDNAAILLGKKQGKKHGVTESGPFIAFDNIGGLSSCNLLAKSVSARKFPDGPIAQQPVAQFSPYVLRWTRRV